MNLKLADVFKYLIRWKYRIIAVVILAFFGARFYVGTIQTSSGQVLIQYNDACVAEGQFPDGSSFEPYQIASPEVLQNVINQLNLRDTVETLRRRIDVSPVIPTSVKEMQAAKAKSGEQYVYNPTIFMISYWGMSNQPAYKIRELLEAVVFEYFNYYSKLYGNYATVNNVLSEVNVNSYDYIELAEIMESSIDSIITKLENYKMADAHFRSASSGASFQDLIYKYEHLRDFKLPEIYANIYKGSIAKDARRLHELYLQKAEDEKLRQVNLEEMAEMTKSRIESFAEANKEVPNAYNYKNENRNNDDLEIIENIYNEHRQHLSTKTTYDTLIENYTNQLIAANDARLQAEYYQENAEVFKKVPDESVDVAMLTAEVEAVLGQTIDDLTELFATLFVTIGDYNEYMVQTHISLLTGVKCFDNVSSALYEMIAIFLSFFGMIILAIGLEIIKAYRKQRNEGEGTETGPAAVSAGNAEEEQ